MEKQDAGDSIWQPSERNLSQISEKIKYAWLRLQHSNPLSTTPIGLLSVCVNHSWLIAEPETVGVPGWWNCAKALGLYVYL